MIQVSVKMKHGAEQMLSRCYSEAVCEEKAWSRVGPKKYLIAGKIQFVTFFIYPGELKICIEHQSPMILSIIYELHLLY